MENTNRSLSPEKEADIRLIKRIGDAIRSKTAIYCNSFVTLEIGKKPIIVLADSDRIAIMELKKDQIPHLIEGLRKLHQKLIFESKHHG